MNKKQKKIQKPTRIEPTWIDEDPDEKRQKNSKTEADIYGDVRPPKKSDQVRSEKTSKSAKNTQRASNMRSLGVKSVSGQGFVLDLHGLTFEQAKEKIDQLFSQLEQSPSFKSFRIITGRGISSQGVGRLARDVHPYVASRYALVIESITISPADVQFGGLPAKGYFDVKIK